MDAIVGQSYLVAFDLRLDEEYVTPDAGTITYTVYDNSGTVMGGLSNVAYPDGSVTANRVLITVPNSSHTVGAGKSFEQRSVELNFLYDGVPHRMLKHYYVTSRLNYRADPFEVLGMIGLKEGEVFADQVDFVRSYFLLASQLTSSGSDLATLLASGTISQINANEAIKVHAALDLMTCIELKAFRKAGGDSLSFQRFEKVDFSALRAELTSRLSTLTEAISSTTTAPTVFQVVTVVDAITGA